MPAVIPNQKHSTPASNPSTPALPPAPPEFTTSMGCPYDYNSEEPPQSPVRPPISPLTPVATLAELAPSDAVERVVPPPMPPVVQEPKFIARPAPVPVSEEDNPDAIALRAAISILQIQREKSKKDIKALQEIKRAALDDPEAYLRELEQGKPAKREDRNDLMAPTLAEHAFERASDPPVAMDIDKPTEGRSSRCGSAGSSSTRAESPPKFPRVPEPQNVVRCPPINWAKYHVVGESLDKMHEEQRKRPIPGEPARGPIPTRAPEAVIAAPYSPWKDRIDPPPQPQKRKSSSKRPG